MRFLPRRTILTAAALSVAACSSDSNESNEPNRSGESPSTEDGAPELHQFDTTVLPLDASPGQIATTVFSHAPTVLVASQSALAEGAKAAESAGLPMLVDGPELQSELDQLGAKTVVVFDGEPEVGDRKTVSNIEELKETPKPTPADAVAVHLADAEPNPAAHAILAAAGIKLQSLTYDDPRATSESVAAVRDSASVLAIGDFGDEELFAGRVDMARNAPELPGGGVAPYPNKFMVALYGHPSGATLGLLGEQGPKESVARVKEFTEKYQPLTDRQATPAFEIITTVASQFAGEDKDYSYETPAEELLPYIDAAEEAGVYCVLDLQPGHTDFLTQAKLYEDLLKKPHVGLALDPEWRLKPGWKHMAQIGQVEIDEVNETGQWLADLVKDNNLPAKILILHQFQTRMIVDRDKLDTSRDEIQYLVHIDGHGSHHDKLSTWGVLKGVPEGVRLGWKNFIDEDAPMMSAKETMELVKPMPDFVSYQ